MLNRSGSQLATPDRIASAILFLAGDAAGMITGHTLPVDGDRVARQGRVT